MSDFQFGKRYTVDVKWVADGDTATVQFSDGNEESVRILGIDSPEKPRNKEHENPEDWEGIDSLDYLTMWGEKATKYGKRMLADETVTLYFDEQSGFRDDYDRLLGYLELPDGTLYNREVIRQGYARVYDSEFRKYDDFASVERQARDDGRRVWERADASTTERVRNGGFFRTILSKIRQFLFG